MEKQVYDYILEEQSAYKTLRVPITSSVEWNMPDHIERCTNVANGWYHTGKNDGLRPYDDIVTPIKNVALRSEGFDAKDIVPFVNDVEKSYKSFIIKKYHPQWARKNELDTFIDEMVESSVVYDLVLVKNVNEARPEVIKLQQIAFCDQTDIMSGAICLKHQYSISQLNEMKGKWDSDKIDEAITMFVAEQNYAVQTKKSNGKYIEVFELHGDFPDTWIGGDSPNRYTPQIHVVCYYSSKDGTKSGITLFKGKAKKMSDRFKALVISPVFGRACGRSIIETLFEPQVWNNYSAQKIKKLLDSAINVFQTDSEEFGNQKLTAIPENTIIKHETGKPVTKLDGSIQNLTAFTNHQNKMENSARVIGSASDAQLGTNPTSGTPFALQNLVVQQGQGIHEYRQGKIATFTADVLYRDWILKFMVDDLNSGKVFSEEFSLDEIQEIGKILAKNEAGEKIKELILKKGQSIDETTRESLEQLFITEFQDGGTRKFIETLKDELKEIPMDVMVNIKGKQRDMLKNAETITNIIREVLRNPQAFSQVPGISKAFNQLLEESGMSPVDFSKFTSAQPTQGAQPVGAEKLAVSK